MTDKIVEFPDRRVIAEEAAAWLIRLDADAALSPADITALREWLSRSPVHREELQSLAVMWEKMNVLTELAVPLGRPTSQPGSGFRLLFSRTALASLVFVAILTSIGLATLVWQSTAPLNEANGLFATAIGQQKTTTLADGSVVLLNTDSQIEVDYRAGFRDLRLLRGEAHFTVAKDSERPFRVFAGTGKVQAIGTAFSVYLKDQSIDVTVTDGRVSLATLNQHTAVGEVPPIADSMDQPLSGSIETETDDYVEAVAALSAGQSATLQVASYSESSARSIQESVRTVPTRDLAKKLSWRDGMLTFSGDPLDVVVSEISRYTPITIEIADPAIRATRIGGHFPVGETEAMFDALEANFGLRVTRMSRDRVVLSAADE